MTIRHVPPKAWLKVTIALGVLVLIAIGVQFLGARGVSNGSPILGRLFPAVWLVLWLVLALNGLYSVITRRHLTRWHVGWWSYTDSDARPYGIATGLYYAALFIVGAALLAGGFNSLLATLFVVVAFALAAAGLGYQMRYSRKRPQTG